MPESSIARLAGVALLALVSLASSQDALAVENPAETSGAYASEVPAEDFAESAAVTLARDNDADTIPVAHELDFVRSNAFHRPYDEALKSVAAVDYYGARYVECEQYTLEIRTARPEQIATRVASAGSSRSEIFEIRKSRRGVVTRGEPKGLSVEDERALLETFEFDTPVLNLEKEHPTLEPLGMQKLPGMLTWKLKAQRTAGPYRLLNVDSHKGDVVRVTVVSAAGAPIIEVKQHDYRDVEGIRVAFAIDYYSPGGTLLASDRFERVTVTPMRP